jgi:hypothetical protein
MASNLKIILLRRKTKDMIETGEPVGFEKVDYRIWFMDEE